LLTLLGQPVGKDMEGRPMVDALAVPAKPDWIPTWEDVGGESGMHSPDRPVEDWEAEQALTQLAALGYIEEPGKDETRAVRVSRMQEKLNLALIYVATDRPAEAVPLLEELIREEPGELSFPVFLANCRLTLGQFMECRHLAERVLQQHPNHPDAELVLGKLCLAEDKTCDALEHLLRAERSTPNLPDLQHLLGTVYLRYQRWADSARAFRRALASEGDNAREHVGLAQVCVGLSKFAEAAAEAERAIRLNDRLASAYYYLGIAHLQLGRMAQAQQAFERCVELDPKAATPHERLAEIHERATGDRVRAAEHRRRVRELAPR
jgi:tetratricopeptide (TPR) repeat protein